MTGRVLMILRENGEWQTTEDLHQLYQTLIDLGFKPDDMTYEDLAQTVHNLKRCNQDGSIRYEWEIFYNVLGHPFA